METGVRIPPLTRNESFLLESPVRATEQKEKKHRAREKNNYRKTLTLEGVRKKGKTIAN